MFGPPDTRGPGPARLAASSVKLALGRAGLVLALLLPGGLAAAQICEAELRSALTDVELERPATGADAAFMLRRAIDLVEPALPQLRRGGSLPVPEEHPAHTTARYLLDRRLLPSSWQADTIDQATWSAMLATFLSWYRLDGPLPDAPVTTGDLLTDLAVALQRVSRTIRPAALLASDPEDDNSLSFWAIIWNWTVYPRLLVVRPEEGVRLTRDNREVLAGLSNCAVRLENFVAAPEETAKRLFLSHYDSRMYVVASRPNVGVWPLAVEPGAELDAFAFRLPELEGARVFAAVFEGPTVGLGTVLGLITRVRTNMSPLAFFGHMETPP